MAPFFVFESLPDPRYHHQAPAFRRRGRQMEITVMNSFLSAGAACLAIASALVATKATAATATGLSLWAGSVCQLSIPTLNTGVRPKATGFRNESATTSNFVICPVSNPMAVSNNNLTSAYVRVYSMDGAAHTVSCTAVSGFDQAALLYSTKTFVVSSADPTYGYTVQWTGVDFGLTSTDPIPGSVLFSVTCNLPPQTAIAHSITLSSYDIGT